MKNKFAFSAAIIAFCATLMMSACSKKFDEPPIQTTTLAEMGIASNIRIDSLKAKVGNTTGSFVEITDSLVITGVVSANDKSGNIYKEIYIQQDSTSAISILIESTGLYNTFPVGREIAVNCKGLWLVNQNGMKKLCQKKVVNGSTYATGILFTSLNSFIHTGAINQPVAIKTTTVPQLDNSLLGMLIRLENFEVASGELTYTYSDISPAKIDQNIDVKSCDGQAIIVRTSAYADFAGAVVPQGNGSITAVYTTYNTTKQLLLRDTSDVNFTGPRCNVFEQDFSSVTNNSILNFPGWFNIGEIGGKQFTGKTFGSSGKVGYITAFGTGQPVITSWLITPGIALAAGTTPHLSFTTSENFDNGATLKALISTNYNGSATPSTATWVDLNAAIAFGYTSSSYSPFITSGQLDLSAYVGQTVHIAFRYDGADPTTTTNFEIDDLKVSSH